MCRAGHLQGHGGLATLLDHPAPQCCRADGHHRRCHRPAHDQRPRAGTRARGAARGHQPAAARNRVRPHRRGAREGRRHLARRAGHRRWRRGLARGRQGHRGKPHREPLPRANDPLHHPGRNRPWLRALGGLGRPLPRRRAVLGPSRPLWRPRGRSGCDLRGVAPRRVPRPPGVSARCPARRGVRVARRGHGGRAPLRTYGLLDCRTRGAAALWPGQQEAALRRARRHDEEPVARWCRWGPPALPCHGWHLIGSGHHVSRAGLLARLRHRQRGRPRLRGGRRDLAGPHEAKAHGQGHPLPRRRGREARRPKLR